MRHLRASLLLLFTAAVCFGGDVVLHNDTTIRFASADEAAAILGNIDPYIQVMSPFDTSSRLQTDREVSKEEYARFAAAQARAFAPEEVARLTAIASSIRKRFDDLGLDIPFPAEVTLIKSTGDEESGAAYCRGPVIIFPQRFVDLAPEKLEGIFVHELFHVLSNQNRQLRPALYGILGFTECNEVVLPKALAVRAITNPDSYENNYRIEIDYRGEKTHVIPVMFSSKKQYEPGSGKVEFSYLVFRLLVVEERDGAWKYKLVNKTPLLLSTDEASDFLTQVGPNTDYLLQPEEILAEDFRHMVYQTPGLPYPQFPQALRDFFSRRDEPANPGPAAEPAAAAVE